MYIHNVPGQWPYAAPRPLTGARTFHELTWWERDQELGVPNRRDFPL